MKKAILLLSILALTASVFAQLPGTNIYNEFFTNKTMRVDYFHTGKAIVEHFTVDRIINDGDWAGSKTNLIDDLDRGLYFFDVLDDVTGRIIYSRGFASIFGEWQTIEEAKTQWGTFHESIRFPWPKKVVKLIISKRDANNNFEKIWETKIDPQSRAVNPFEYKRDYKTFNFAENGPAEKCVDVVILGDGYTAQEMGKFRSDVARLTNVLFSVEPFKTRKANFNVRGVETPSPVSGVNRPHPGVFKQSALSASYGAFDSERYVLSYDNRTVRDVAATVPYDYMFILVNERTYGGGGIFNLYSTVCTDNKFSDYIFVHEFGHSFAALADEYYTSDVSYEAPKITIEPWEPNVTALLDKDNLKWKDVVAPGTPIPTPWNKKEFDDFGYKIQEERRAIRAANKPEEVMEALFEKQRMGEAAMFEKMQYKSAAGAFEGANYMQNGLYRSAVNCMMYTRSPLVFCPACQRAINQMIDLYSK